MPGDPPDEADCSQCVKALDNCCSVRGICCGVPPTMDIVDTVGCTTGITEAAAACICH